MLISNQLIVKIGPYTKVWRKFGLLVLDQPKNVMYFPTKFFC